MYLAVMWSIPVGFYELFIPIDLAVYVSAFAWCDGCIGVSCVCFPDVWWLQRGLCVFSPCNGYTGCWVCVLAWSYSCICYCVTLLLAIWCLLTGTYVHLFLSAMVAFVAVIMMGISSSYLSTGSWGKTAIKSINSARQALVNMKWHPCIAFSDYCMLKPKCCYLIGIRIKFLWFLNLFPILQSF